VVQWCQEPCDSAQLATPRGAKDLQREGWHHRGEGLGFRVQDLQREGWHHRGEGLGFRVQDLQREGWHHRGEGLGFRV
jgi:hypothetical protein